MSEIEPDYDGLSCERCGIESASICECDELPISRTCVTCGQLTLTSADPLCTSCIAATAQPQGQAVRLFEPAPTQLEGQMFL